MTAQDRLTPWILILLGISALLGAASDCWQNSDIRRLDAEIKALRAKP